MTEEQRRARENDEHVKYVSERICNKDSGKDYVFISYKSDDWEIVLKDVVYRLVKDYGLNVYFDGDFNIHNSLWVKQFPENMNNENCKGIIAFIDNKYIQSYATVMELLHSQTKLASVGGKQQGGLPVVPVNLERLKKPDNNADTGLGRTTFKDGSVNANAQAEKKVFNKAYKQLVRRRILRDSVDWYAPEDDDMLTVRMCSEIAIELIGSLKVNENPYIERGASLEGIKQSIKDVCGETVFQNPETPVSMPSELSTDAPVSMPSELSADVPVSMPSELSADASVNLCEEYVYTIFGKEYRAGKGEQGKLMYDVFEALMERHPDRIPYLTQRTSVERAESVQQADTKDARPTYFRACRKYQCGGQEYYVGTSYSKDAKLAEIKGMLKICAEPQNAFVLVSQPGTVKRGEYNKMPESIPAYQGTVDGTQEVVGQQILEEKEAYVYTIFGREYRAFKQGKMMYDTFEALMERHPDRIPDLTQCTCVERAELVKQANTPESKPNYFRICQKYQCGGQEYYVGASYSKNAKIAEIRKMLKICGEPKDAFVLVSQPGKEKRVRANAPVNGLGALLQ